MTTNSPTNFQDGTWKSGSTPLSSPADHRETYMGGNNGNGAGVSNVLNNAGRLEFLRPVDRPGRPAHPYRQLLSRRRQDRDVRPRSTPYFVYYDVGYDGHTVTMTADQRRQLRRSSSSRSAAACRPSAAPSRSARSTSKRGAGRATRSPRTSTCSPATSRSCRNAGPLGGVDAALCGEQSVRRARQVPALGLRGRLLGRPGPVDSRCGGGQHRRRPSRPQPSWNWSGLYAYQGVGTANGAIANFDYHNTISSARVDPYAAEVLRTAMPTAGPFRISSPRWAASPTRPSICGTA